MREAVIVSTARTGLAKSFRGGFNNTNGAAMSAPTLKAAMERAKIDPAEVDDWIQARLVVKARPLFRVLDWLETRIGCSWPRFNITSPI